jgi:catechol 2,3-dioxygenase-like lactoylglutathione lyase family enzyme
MSKTLSMRGPLLLAVLAVMLSNQSLFAQLAPFNDRGVTNGHIHFLVRDLELQKKLWMDVFGAEVVNFGKLETLKVPGIFVLIIEKEPTGGSAGSTVDHFGMAVKDLAATKAKLAAANIPASDDSPFVTLPDGIRMELLEDKDLGVPAAFHHIQFVTDDAAATREWYVKTFGATPSKQQANMLTATFPAGGNFPGTILYFLEKPGAEIAPTQGRSIDHISFEIRDLEAFCKTLEVQGIKLDMPFTDAPQIGLKVTFVTDPFGTRIELTEGFAGK